MQRLPLALSLAALVVAVLGATPVGHAVADAVAPNSVGTPQLKTGAVTTVKLRANAVTTAKLRANAVTSIKILDGTLKRADFGPGLLGAGAQGPAGPQGPTGPAGPAGPRGVGVETAVWRSGANSIAASATEVSFANCQAGERAYAGGFSAGSDLRVRLSSPDSLPNATRWRVDVTNTAAAARNLTVYALCVPTS